MYHIPLEKVFRFNEEVPVRILFWSPNIGPYTRVIFKPCASLAYYFSGAPVFLAMQSTHRFDGI